jgi:hypothetical protein
MKGWKPIPLSLKILSIVLILWALMSVSVLFTMPDRKIAFFGLLLTGLSANIVVLLLDLISPLLFIYALWNRLKWGANFGMLYNAVFILNNIMALFTFREVFGNGIYFPLIASLIFFFIIYRHKNYFS